MSTHTRFRLRIDGRDEVLTVGEWTVGRGTDCDVLLDDPMASRRHAVLRVSTDGVELQDLGSRNGVLVNGVKMFEPVALHHGDRVLVGSSELFLIEAARRRREDMATRPLQTSGVRGRSNPARTTAPDAPSWDSEVTNAGSVYDVLIAACDRALLQGDVQEASAAVRNLLLSTRAAMLRRQAPDDHTLKAVVGFALQMAERTSDPSWLDRMFEVFATGRKVPGDSSVQRLSRLVPRLGMGGSEAVRSYVSRMSGHVAELDADARRRLDNLTDVMQRVGT